MDFKADFESEQIMTFCVRDWTIILNARYTA